MKFFKQKACLWACLFFIPLSHGKIIKDDNFITGEKKFPWDAVCRKLTKRNSPLIEYHSINKLDCMGEVKDVTSFCDEKEAGNPYFARAVVSKKDKTVICQSSKRVILKWECKGKEDRYCKDPEIGCFLFKEKLARRLKAAHQSLTEDKKYLNCYFDTGQNALHLNI